MTRVLVSGLGCLSAAGRYAGEAWRSLTEGPGPLPAPPERLLKLARTLKLEGMGHPAFLVPDDCFKEGFRHSAKDTVDLAHQAALEAISMAGLSPREMELMGDRCGLVFGSTAGNALHFLKDYYDHCKGLEAQGEGFADFFQNNPAQALARKLTIDGPAFTVGNACASATDAIGLGLELIASGRCDRVLAGGADALSLIPYIGFKRLMICSENPCRPFDRQRDGLNLGEGAGFLLLESAALLEKRKGRPLARLLGYGAASDAHHLTAPHPEGEGLKHAIARALKRAALSPEALAFVSAHGTATLENDRVESLAIKAELPGVPVWAVKGSTGHSLGAAGGLEAALTVLALHHGVLPPSHGFVEADDALGLSPTTFLQPISKGAAISLSLGFGGSNAALVFEGIR